MDPYTVCEGLTDSIKRNIDLSYYQAADVTVYPFTPDSIVAPAVVVQDYSVEFDTSFSGASRRGQDVITVTLAVLVGRADDLTSQRLLSGMMAGSGSASLKVALEAGRAPGVGAFPVTSFFGACDDYRLEQMQANRLYTIGTSQYIGAQITVRCIGSGG